MIKDFSSNEVVSSVLNKKLIKHNHNNYSFISLFGDFFITADRFLPICVDNFCTSTDLFGFYEKPKYRHLLTEHFYNLLNSNRNIIEINNSATSIIVMAWRLDLQAHYMDEGRNGWMNE